MCLNSASLVSGWTGPILETIFSVSSSTQHTCKYDELIYIKRNSSAYFPLTPYCIQSIFSILHYSVLDTGLCHLQVMQVQSLTIPLISQTNIGKTQHCAQQHTMTCLPLRWDNNRPCLYWVLVGHFITLNFCKQVVTIGIWNLFATCQRAHRVEELCVAC